MIKLTQTVQKGGCAAKVAASELRSILSQVQFPPNDTQVLVDGGLFDDAAIYKIADDVALVQTLDFFTPIVDSPYLFGKIAAANALSDVYAMGGEPKTALGILAFPLATLPSEIAVQVLQGASDVLREAQTSFVGGHSIDDDTLKFGLSVTGIVHPLQIWSNDKARPGDSLVLTKALGTGTVTAGLKRQAYAEDSIQEVLLSMAQVNRVRDLLSSAQLAHIHAATHITGFGLAGHGMNMALASQMDLEISFSQLPVFAQAWTCLEQGLLTKAHRTNAEYVGDKIRFEGAWTDLQKKILFDPQTSGGLLLSVSPEGADEIVQALKMRFPKTQIIGRVGNRVQGPSLKFSLS